MEENQSSSSTAPFPRPGSVVYKFLFGDKEEKMNILKRWKCMNKFITIPLYKMGIIPLIGFSRVFLLLYTKGRKTGEKRITPLEYRKKDSVIHIVAARGHVAHWFKNLITNPEDIMIKIGFRKSKAYFKLIRDIKEKNAFLTWYVKKYPRAAKFLFGWDPKNDDPKNIDFSSFSELVELIQLHKK